MQTNPFILIIHSDRDKLALLRAMLINSIAEAKVLTAYTGQSGLELAISVNPDAILLDMDIPGMDGLQLCLQLNNHPKTAGIPVVFLISEQANKKTKIAALEVGAYASIEEPVDQEELVGLIKAMIKVKTANTDRQRETSRLSQDLETKNQELIEAYKEILRLMESIKQQSQQEKKIKDLLGEVESLGCVGSFEIGAETGKIELSETALQIIGLDRIEFGGTMQELRGWIHPNDFEWVEQRFQDAMISGETVELIARILNPQKGERIVYCTYKPLENNAGIGLIQDITEQEMLSDKLAYNAEELRYAFENAAEGKVITSQSGELHANKAFCQMMGYSLEEMADLRWENLTHPDDLEKSQREKNMLLNGEKIFSHFIKRYIRKDGSVVWADVRLIMRFDVLGKPDTTIASIIDITERKNIEDALKESEQNNRRLITQMPQGLALHEIILDKDGKPVNYRFLDVNESFERLTGLKRENIVGKTVRELMPETEPFWIETYGRVTLTGEPAEVENYSSTLKKYFHVSVFSPKPLQFATIITDITENMFMQKELADSESRFRALSEHTLIGVSMLDKNRKRIYVNAQYAKMLGYEIDELMGIDILDGVHPDDVEKVKQSRLNGRQNSSHIQCRRKTKTGEYKDLEVFATMTRLNDKPITIASIIDITERKKMEGALKESEQKHRRLITQMPQGLALHELILDEDGKPVDYRFLDVNESYERLTGLKRENIVGKTAREVLPGADLFRIEEFSRVALTGTPAQFENYAHRPKKYFHVSAYSPKPLQFATIITDVTEFRSIQNKLADSESRFKALSEHTLVGVSMLDKNRKRIFVNAQYAHMLGYKVDELMGIDVLNSVHPDDVARVKQSVEDRLSGREKSSYIEYRRKNKAGEYIDLEVFATMTTLNGETVSIASIIDITERMRAQKALAESEMLFRSVFDSSLLGISMLDAEGRYIKVNDRICDMLGYDREELVGMSVFNVTHPDYVARAMNTRTRLLSNEIENTTFEKQYIRKDGSAFWAHGTICAMRDAQGDFKYNVTYILDITDQKNKARE